MRCIRKNNYCSYFTTDSEETPFFESRLEYTYEVNVNNLKR